MKSSHAAICVFLYCLLLFSFGAQEARMEFKGDENFYFESSKRMLETGDILTPRYRNEERFQKPILFYWLILLSFKVFGVSWFAARLPSIFFGSLCAVLIFKIAEMFFRDRKTAFFSAGFAATAPLYYRYARLAVPDMSLVFFETLTLYFFIDYYNLRKGAGLKLFFAAMAAAFLIKGPVGAIIPLSAAIIFCFLKKERIFKFDDVAIGALLFLLITAPWFCAMCAIFPGRYASQVVGREILERIGWGRGWLFITACFKGVAYYAAALITKYFPYSLFMPPAFAGSYTAVFGRRQAAPAERPGHLFLLIWAAAVFLFFSFVTERREHYLLALAPPVSIMVGYALARRIKNGTRLALTIVLTLSLIYAAVNIFQPFGLFTNKMERAALSIKANMKEGDRIGIGSHGIIPEELQVYFEAPVELVKATYTAEGRPDMSTAPQLNSFLTSKGGVFCVIKKKDYDIFITKEIKETMHIIDSYFVWKRRIRVGELKESMGLEGAAFLRSVFQNEIIVVSNRAGRT